MTVAHPSRRIGCRQEWEYHLAREDKETAAERAKSTRPFVATEQTPTWFSRLSVATVAFYGPTDKLATKVVVSIILTENSQPDFLQRWFSDDQSDVRNDPAIGEQVLAFLKAHAPRSTVVADRIIGCPHEEGTDYADGTACPQCPYWAGRDRFTHERIQ